MQVVKTACQAGDPRVASLISGLGRPPGGGNGNPLQYSCLGNSMDRGAWQATVHEVAKSQTQPNNNNPLFFPLRENLIDSWRWSPWPHGDPRSPSLHTPPPALLRNYHLMFPPVYSSSNFSRWAACSLDSPVSSGFKAEVCPKTEESHWFSVYLSSSCF